MPVEVQGLSPALDFLLDGLSQHQQHFTKPSLTSGIKEAIKQWINAIPETELALSSSARESLITRFTNECLALQASQIIDNEDAPFSLSKLYQHCKQQNHEVTVGLLVGIEQDQLQKEQRALQKEQRALQKQKKQSAIQMGGLLLIPCLITLCEHTLLPMIPFEWAQNIVSGIQHFMHPAAWNSTDHIMLILALSAILILPCLCKLAARIDQIDADLKSIKDALTAIGRSIPLNEHRPASAEIRTTQPAALNPDTEAPAALDPDTEGAANRIEKLSA